MPCAGTVVLHLVGDSDGRLDGKVGWRWHFLGSTKFRARVCCCVAAAGTVQGILKWDHCCQVLIYLSFVFLERLRDVNYNLVLYILCIRSIGKMLLT